MRENNTECYQVNTCNAKNNVREKEQRPKRKDRKRKKIPIKYHRPLATYRSHTISGRGGALKGWAEAFRNRSITKFWWATARNPIIVKLFTAEAGTDLCTSQNVYKLHVNFLCKILVIKLSAL